ncbi:MAG: hypothetical protein ACI3VD_05150 [Candidatus Limivicinus sp.]
MTLAKCREQWHKNGRLRLLAALLVNAGLLLVLLCCFTPRFETNDDVLMSKFVDGQMGEKSAYIPFINIVLGFFLKLLYTMGGAGLNWYSISMYALMLAAFTAMTWVLLMRFRPLGAWSMAAVILMTVGLNSYLYPCFSKTCAVAAAGGLCLMLQAMGDGLDKPKRLTLVLGLAMAVMGFLWRYEEFFAVAALMAPVGLVQVLELLRKTRGEKPGQRLGRVWRYARPFLLLILLVLLLFGLDRFLWTRGDYAFFTEYNDARSMLVDFSTVPDYDQMQQVYDSLDMDENAVYFLKNWSFYDTEKFSLEKIRAVLDARDSVVPNPSPGECLGIFLDKALPGLARTLAGMGFALMLMLWLACGRHRWQDWLGLGISFGFFGLIYLLMIYQNRYLANRVDMGLLLALMLTMSFLMDEAKLRNDRIFCALLMALALAVGLYTNKNVCKLSDQYDVEDKSAKKAAIEQLLADEEHLYLCKVWSIDHELYTPLETAPAGFADRIVLLGGWSLYHPSIEHVLEAYEIENPYPDMIGNEQVRLIDSDVERTLAYLREYYDPDAQAEPVEPLSTETGLKVYRILGGGT